MEEGVCACIVAGRECSRTQDLICDGGCTQPLHTLSFN